MPKQGARVPGTARRVAGARRPVGIEWHLVAKWPRVRWNGPGPVAPNPVEVGAMASVQDPFGFEIPVDEYDAYLDELAKADAEADAAYDAWLDACEAGLVGNEPNPEAGF